MSAKTTISKVSLKRDAILRMIHERKTEEEVAREINEEDRSLRTFSAMDLYSAKSLSKWQLYTLKEAYFAPHTNHD